LKQGCFVFCRLKKQSGAALLSLQVLTAFSEKFNSMISVKTTLDSIQQLRNDYFNSLPEFQELYIEMMIPEADYFLLRVDGRDAGYFIRNKEGVLIEFYLFVKFIPRSQESFNRILNELQIREIYCKSFDALLLTSCLSCQLSYSVMGALYRDYASSLTENDPGISMVKSTLSSTELWMNQDKSIRELFETEKQLAGFIQSENVFEFYKTNELIGCGMIIRTITGWDYCDLGVWVKPSQRGHSYGSQIILKLRNFALRHNLKPSCGCAIDNIASRKAIEKSGFVSKHKLIHFKIDPK
jgi:GNAT superfamily N-acetyltransferase